MRQYLDLCKDILENGTIKQDRTGTGTISVFGRQMRFNLSEGFPLVTTKDMAEKFKNGSSSIDNIIHELLWFIDGASDLRTLVLKGCNIWNADAYRHYKSKTREHTPLTLKAFIEQIRRSDMFSEQWGNLGRIYGKQWRSWYKADTTTDNYGIEDTNHLFIDQLANVIESIKKDPNSRRHIVTAWNPGELDEMVLPPCHIFFQFYVADGKLSCQMYQRSGDVFLGVPYNIASYALLTMMVADQCGLEYGEFVHTIGDAHIYLNHVEQVKLQLTREPSKLPTMWISKLTIDIDDYKWSDFLLQGYNAHPPIKGKVSVGD